MVKYNGQLKGYQFKSYLDVKKHKPILRSNSIMVLDIEVTSAWLTEDGVIGYETGHDAEYWNEKQPLALPYIWQFSCDGTVYYGREWRDFLHVLDDIPRIMECEIWVHNLSYEFMFLSNFLHWKDVFARNKHKPIKAVSVEYPNITFRCSYFLTRLSLATWGEQLGQLKLVGDLDYEPIRTPYTELTKKELAYCEQDCLIVEAGIKQYVKQYGNQNSIPLTQTGTVRLEAKNRLFKNRRYGSFIKKLVPKHAREYKRLQKIFAGGYSHANYWYSGKTIRGVIEHYDFASSYPTVMVCEKYPMSPWVYTGKHTMPKDSRFADFAYIAHIKVRKLTCTSFNTYLQRSKCAVVNSPEESDFNHDQFDNGRIRKAYELETWITEQDWLTIKNNYEWESLEVLHLYESRKEYLPRELVNYILELYANKTELKGVAGKEELYLQSKQYINSIFGMMVTAIVQADVTIEGDEWKVSHLTEDFVDKKLVDLKGMKDRKYFLSYSWGCWVTAYARRNLWRCIESVDSDVLYCDTDSIFVMGHHEFSWYNNLVTQKIYDACKAQGLLFSRTRPKTPKGVEKPLGIFEKEDECTEFKTLGAKRYVERRLDGHLYLTVSGINKEAVHMLHDNIDNFTDGFNFDKDSLDATGEVTYTNKKTGNVEPCVKKRLSTYVTDMPEVTYPDGYVSTFKYGINMRRTGYELTMTDEYKDLIKMCELTEADLPEQFEVNLRGRFTVRNLTKE